MKLISLIFLWMVMDWRWSAAFNILVFPVHLPSRANFYEFLQTHLVYSDHNVSFLIYKSDTKNLQIQPPPQTVIIDDCKDPHSLQHSPRNYLEDWEQTVLSSIGIWSETYAEVPDNFLKSLASRCQFLLGDKNILQTISQMKLDMILVDLYGNDLCGLALGRKLKVVVAGYVNGHLTEPFSYKLATPYNPAYLPVTGENDDLDSLMGRFNNAYKYTKLISYWDNSYFEVAAEAACFPGSKCVSIGDLYKRLSVVFVNSDLALESIPRPLTPNIVFLAGLHCQISTLLPKDIDSVARSYRAGVIYVSFITALNGTDLPKPLVHAVIEGLGSLSYATFWKTNYLKHNNVSHPKNVFMEDTFSTQDVLGHGRTRLAFTLCDINSIISSVYHGVPFICIPITKEQLHIARTLVEAKSIGAVITLDKITPSILAKTAQDIIANASYRHNSRFIGDLLRDKSETPSDRLVFWVEYAIRRKGLSNLKFPAVGMSSYRFLFLDALTLLLFSACIAAFATLCVIKVVNYRKIAAKEKTAKSD